MKTPPLQALWYASVRLLKHILGTSMSGYVLPLATTGRETAWKGRHVNPVLMQVKTLASQGHHK